MKVSGKFQFLFPFNSFCRNQESPDRKNQRTEEGGGGGTII